jgi:signal transduction histidine kinase
MEGAMVVHPPADPQGQASQPAPVRLAPAEVASHLSWLAPDAHSLAALACSCAPSQWSEVCDDPGAVLLLVCCDAHTPATGPVTWLADPDVLTLALERLDRPSFCDWNQPACLPIWQAAVCIARLARALCVCTHKGDPARAWAAGLLAPLGWLGIAAVDPTAAAACLADHEFRQNPGAVQARTWGLEHDALARRLARRWLLPDWLSGIVGRLHLSPEAAAAFGADVHFFRIVQAAAGLGAAGPPDSGCANLGLVWPAAARESAAALGVGLTELRSLLDTLPPAPTRAAWQSPAQAPFLRELLTVARARRTLDQHGRGSRLLAENDALHRALEAQIRGEAERLQTRKLAAVAELAAGAGHEINNPLAVISSQAQYLLKKLRIADCGSRIVEEEASPEIRNSQSAIRNSLEAIIGQTKRIHGLLRDLMLFARPPAPAPTWIDLPTLLGETAAAHLDLAAQRQVRIEVHALPDRLAVHADGEQLRQALSCLLRNAIEAAGAAAAAATCCAHAASGGAHAASGGAHVANGGAHATNGGAPVKEGWARLVLDRPEGVNGLIEVSVEDSGPGPSPEQVPALFDPFYSGRTAGRGRGLGLPIAWRLVQQQGGDLRLDPPAPGRPTRFVLTLPSPAAAPAPPPQEPPVVVADSNGTVRVNGFCHT